MLADRDLDELLCALERQGPSAEAVDLLEARLRKQEAAPPAGSGTADPRPDLQPEPT